MVASHNGWKCVQSFPFHSLAEVINAAKELNPAVYSIALMRFIVVLTTILVVFFFPQQQSRAEGFVVCDANFQRIKVKSPQYVAITGLTIKDA